MKKLLSIIILILLSSSQINAYTQIVSPITEEYNYILTLGDNRCKDIKATDRPTIFIPGITASWYSEQGYKDSKIKRWVPDPITHSYDTLFYAFKQNGYSLKDVFYTDELTLSIVGNPKQSLYLFGYDWKKDNKITAKLLSNLILQIREKYEQENGCDIGTVNIIGHSMGGLVARAMLEDICADEEEYKAYYLDKKPKNGQLKDFKTTSCENYTRVNSFITISTPHRGSPSSFPVWERGDIGQTEVFIKSSILKGQLGISDDNGLYRLLHGFDNKMPNGIITIGQLLPNIPQNGAYNSDLLYLEKNGIKLNANNYTHNSFLDDLNNRENIDTMFSNISGKFTSYYSEVTGGHDKNNIIGYNISEKFNYSIGVKLLDLTDKIDGGDIYSKYLSVANKYVYNISENIRNSGGAGGDGTVPSKNLKLLANDSYDPAIEKNDKFESKLIKCYDEKMPFFTESQLTSKVGDVEMELCSHSKMPILTAVNVYEQISGNIITNVNGYYSINKEQELLYSYLGYADYNSSYNVIKKGLSLLGLNSHSSVLDILSGQLSNIFGTGVYNNMFKNEGNISKFINDKKNADRKSLDFSGKLGQVYSLLRYEILSPINLIIEDEQGRRIGIDPETGMIINEIPGAWTSGDTEGANEPEFFLIPRTGTGKILNKIHSYGTGDGEYHIVMNEIKSESFTGKTDETANFVIAGTAKTGIVEDYLVGIEGNKANYKLLDTKVSGVLKKVELKEKYKDILEKLYKILDTKYTKKSKTKLKENLIKFREVKNNKYTDDEKISFLIDMIIEYIK